MLESVHTDLYSSVGQCYCTFDDHLIYTLSKDMTAGIVTPILDSQDGMVLVLT